MFEPPRLELAAAVLTGAAALTLIPHSRSLAVAVGEALVWIAFLLASGLCIATFGDPKLQEATASIAWGVANLFGTQVSFVMGIVRAWLLAHRFLIANWVVLAAGVDAFALVFLRTARVARRSQPRVHLGEWFELPRVAVRPAVVPAVDPLAGIDRRVAAALRTEWLRVESSPVVARAAAGASHLLGPGHLRLLMVKLALKLRWQREELAHAGAAAGAGVPPGPATRSRRPARAARHHPRRNRKAARATNVIPIGGTSQRQRSPAGSAKDGISRSAPALSDRAAS